MLVGNFYSSSSGTLLMYRVKRPFLHDAALWPVGAIRLWSAVEADDFACNHFKTHFGFADGTAEVWFMNTFEEVEWK